MSNFWKLFEAEPETRVGESPHWNPISAPGTPLVTANLGAPAAVFPRDDALFWAMQNLPVSEATKHFLCCGAIGSGKTTAIKLLLQSIAPRFRESNARPEQLVIFDAKGDVIPFLSSLGFSPESENFWILNPYDKRGAVWHLGNVAKTPLMARRLATLLIPEEKRSNAPYFSDGARELVYAAILSRRTVFEGVI